MGFHAGERGEVANPAQQPPRDARGAAGAAGDLARPVAGERHAEHPGAAAHDLFQLLGLIEAQPRGDAETVAERGADKARTSRRRHQREGRQVDADGTRARPFSDDQVELEVLHRRIEDFLDLRVQAVDFVDEQHVARFEVGEQRREVAGPRDHRPGSAAESDSEFARDDARQGGLAEAGRAVEEHVVERLRPPPGGLDEHAEIVHGLALADEGGEAARARAVVGILFRGPRVHQPRFVVGAQLAASSLRPPRTRPARSPPAFPAAARATAACASPRA